MAYSYVDYPSMGAGQTRAIPFPYIAESHIVVTVGGVVVSPSLYTIVGVSSLQTLAGFPSGDGRIRRRTPIDAYGSVQSGTSALDWEGMVGNFKVTLYVLQEYVDGEAERDGKVAAVDTALAAALVTISAQLESAQAAADLATTKASQASGSASSAASSATAAATFLPSNYYLKTEVDSGFYTKAAVDSAFYTKSAMDTALAAKASLAGAETLTNKTLTSPTLNTPSLILKQSANPTPTAEGDMQWDTDDNRLVIGDGAGQQIFNANDWVKIGRYGPSSVSSVAITNLGAFKFLRIVGAFTCSNATTTMCFRVSADNGTSWIQGATDYAHVYVGQSNGVSSANAQNFAFGLLSSTSFQSGVPRMCSLEFSQWNTAIQKHALGRCIGIDSGGQNAHYLHGTRMFNGAAVALNALNLFPGSGTFSADFYLEGLK